jgi:hypothetical protein
MAVARGGGRRLAGAGVGGLLRALEDDEPVLCEDDECALAAALVAFIAIAVTGGAVVGRLIGAWLASRRGDASDVN